MEFSSVGWQRNMGGSPWFSPTRLIPTLSGTQYGTIDTPITFTGDFEVEFTFSSTDVSANRTIAGHSSSRPVVHLTATTGTLKYFFLDSVSATVSLEIPTTNWADGKVHTGKISKAGDVYQLECEGEIINTTEIGALNQTWDLIGTYSTILNPFVGEFLSAKFTDAGTVVANYVFDSGSTTDQPGRGGVGNVSLTNFATTDWNRYTLQRNIVHDGGTIAEAWVGDNLVVNGGFDADTDWTKEANWTIGSGVATHSVGAGNFVYQIILTLGTPYLLVFDVPRIDAGLITGYIGSTTPSQNYAVTGVKKFFGVCSGNSRLSLFGGATCDADADNVSVSHVLEVA